MNRFIAQVLVAAICFGFFGTAYFRLLDVYREEGETVTQKFAKANQEKETHVYVTANLVSIDPVKGDVVMRLQFDPEGDLLNEDEVLARPTTVYTNSTAGKADVSYKKGETIQPQDVTLSLQGRSSQYPWDTYTSTLDVTVAQQQVVDGEKELVDVPVVVEVKTGLPGFVIESRELSQKAKKPPMSPTIMLDVKRARSAVGFAEFIMWLIGLLTLMAFLVGLVVVVGGRKVELAMLGWFGALLFAMVPLRNAMPGAPPIGCVADYMSFFWAEAIIAAVLVATVITWVVRKPS